MFGNHGSVEKRYPTVMVNEEPWQKVVRVVWLTGGAVAVNELGRNVEIRLGVDGPAIYCFLIPSYGALFGELAVRGFETFGCTFIQDEMEVLGLRPPDFRAAGLFRGWHLWETHQSWRQIAFHAHKAQSEELADVASRVACGMQQTELRLLDLTSIYGTQLRGYLYGHAPEDYQCFSDSHSRMVYKCIHAFFWEMAVLRDTLAEFVATILLRVAGISTYRGLLKELRKNPVSDPFFQELLQAGDPNSGWITKFTDYRNLFTHVAPLQQISNRAFAVQDIRELLCGLRLPQLYYPLPMDAKTAADERQGRPPKSGSVKFIPSRHVRASEPDALEYLHRCLCQYVEICKQLSSKSPIAARPIVLTPKDMIGPVRQSKRQ